METVTSTDPGAAADQMEWATTANLVIIAIGMVLALLVIVWGARMRARRKAAERTLAENQGTVLASPEPVTEPQEGPLSVPAVAQAQPSLEPTPKREAFVPPAPPPVAPSPPPLADEPVVAAAAPVATPALEAASVPEPAATGADDFTRMKGVGPKLAARLGELGITRFDQIAALSPTEAEALDAQLGSFRGRLTRDRWIEQARFLAAGDTAGFETAFGRL